MDDFIPRYAAIDALTEEALVQNLDSIYDSLSKRVKRSAQRVIASVPAADVRPVVKATWIRCNRGAGFKCSACKARVSNADVVNGNHRFCYKCGAMMDKDGYGE